jgi:hypothetical protein
MDKKRKVYAPFSLTSEAGVAQTPVEGYIDVNQTIYPTVNTGTVNENGRWTGVKSNDLEFKGFTKDEAIADSTTILVPTGSNANDNRINMEGFKDIQFALKITNTGNYAFSAIMGPSNSENRFLNLSPVNAGENLQGAGAGVRGPADRLDVLFEDGADNMTADAWHVFTIFNVLANQNNLQFKVTNNSGGNSDIEFAYRRLV